ncbi:hypothetical protein H4S14_001290 [Agrobacterium vitis]|nr:hypothetical protein [Agrobacterium vitis]MBE1437552.1 hypothetical protein [Agrobacterium vitis]
MNMSVSNNLKMKVRAAERSRVRMNSSVRYLKQIADCRIIDISRGGLALELYTAFHAAEGSTVAIESEQIGLLEGIVRWSRGGRLGIQFRQNSNSIAKVSAYFRNFHQEVKPVLKR